METQQIAQLLNNTLSPNGDVVHSATDALGRLSITPNFAFSLLSIATGGENHGQRIAAATYLKNFTRQNMGASGTASKVNKEFRDALMRALLQTEPAILKILIEAFRVIVDAAFVKENLWPELVPELRLVIQDSDLINRSGNSKWNTINALTVLHSVIRPFQYFLNPKVAKEPVPPHLELISQEILVPLLAIFHQCVEDLCTRNKSEVDAEKILLIVCKCMYFAVRSHMPSALAPLLPSLCHDLFRILHSLRFDDREPLEDGYMLRLKTGKRSLLIFCALITRHRKYSDKLMPDIINTVVKLVKLGTHISNLDILSERIVSLAFDVISRVLETGPGWRLVSPHFSSLLESAILPALVINEKDIAEWEEDADEYIRKNLPSDLEEISGFREDLFTPRKSALNLLGVIAISKGPPLVASASSKRKKGEKNKQKVRSFMGELLVIPFLSKFPIPSDVGTSVTKIMKDYYGVLMAYGSLVDFFREQKPAYTTTLIRTRVLPLYRASVCHPYLVASANWVLGELVSCIPEEMSTDVYSSLLKALIMADMGDISCHPVRVSAAGAIAQFVENDFSPPEWLPVLQVVVGRIRDNDEDTPVMFELLKTLVEAGNDHVAPHIPHIVSLLAGGISKNIPHNPEPWPQMVERGFAALSVMAQCWEEALPQQAEHNKLSEISVSGRATIARAFSDLLQEAWLTPLLMEGQTAELPPLSSIDDSSTLLRFIISDVNENDVVQKLKVSELLLVWADLIADWHAWEEEEDLSIFNCIKEVAYLHKKIFLKNFIVGDIPSPPAPPVPHRSILEGICAFVSEAFSQYPSAIYRASSSVHILLHVPTYSFETEAVIQALIVAFTQSAYSSFRQKRIKPCPLWKPLLLAISSCYLCNPDIVEKTLVKEEHEGFTNWASSLCSISSSEFEPGLSTESEIKLTVMALAKVITRLLSLGNQNSGLLRDYFAALMEASVRLKEVQEDEEEEEEIDENEEEDASDEDSEDDEDEDSEDDEREETEEEFLERCAQAAVALENGTVVEEVDEEDEDQEIELGGLEEVDQLSIVRSLIERYHQILLQGPLPEQLISSFLEAFPECSLYFGL